MTVTIVKLGVGNTASVMFALSRLGRRAVLSDDPDTIAEAERVIVPGVGAARHAMSQIDDLMLRDVLRSFPRPLLGICLGQQLLYERSAEGDAVGLGLFFGTVEKLQASPSAPTPHMGWSKLEEVRDHPLTEGVGSGAYAYFAHSYACPLGPEAIATAEHGVRFPAMIARGNVFGCQFHPERSGVVGERVLANFLGLPC